MFKVGLYNQEGKELKKIELDKEVFDGLVNQGVIYQAVRLYQANQRRGLASTKTRGEVSGGGIKPWRQKGTGRARHGSIRSPLWRGGGVVFGPHRRDFSQELPKQIKRKALISSLNAKLKDDKVLILEKIELDVAKTKNIFNILQKLKLDKSSVLFVIDKTTKELQRSVRNIPRVCLAEANNLNANLVLAHKNLLLTEDSLKGLLKFLKK